MSNQKRALVTGCGGQDGSFLCEFLLSKGYEVHGMVRRTSTPNTLRLDHILSLITLHTADMTDHGSIVRTVDEVRPHEVYNLAAQSFVHASWDHPISTADITAIGVTRILDAIKLVDKDIKFYQASSSEMFGHVKESPQSESTEFYPRSPYAISKVFGHWTTINYRESYDMFCCSGILFNHESERRGIEFVTRKITHAAARIKLGLQDKLYLGNMEAKRDWGHAKDYVRAMWLMLQQDSPDDYVVGSGETHSVLEFASAVFDYLDLDYSNYIEIDPKFYRPADVNLLLSDPSKARKDLGWYQDISFEELIKIMVDSDLKLSRAHC